ncbi:MAG: A/G-specific adenine glycosylase [Chlamydiae bacterium]|nr:A/G-specific adenine glycosylase [Chlamydiota bacterium]
MQFSCRIGILLRYMDFKPLTDWFLQRKRSFPWRENITPYSVWVSEVMLQQTRADVVRNYYLAWMQKFPTLEAFASAKEEEVIKAWEGLGYYSRVKNLHKAAKIVVSLGRWPQTKEEWLDLPGVGPYTAGAVLSFAFHQKAVALDANVHRVASRLYCKEKGLDALIEAHLPDDQPYVAMEALIELGALVCKKTPLCAVCPLKLECAAFKENQIHLFPLVKKRAPITHLYRHLYCIFDGKRLFLQKGEKGKAMADLWQFPYKEVLEKSFDQIEPLENMEFLGCLDQKEHTFTRYRAFLRPLLFYGQNPHLDGEWIDIDKVKDLAFSSGHRRVLEEIVKEGQWEIFGLRKG